MQNGEFGTGASKHGNVSICSYLEWNMAIRTQKSTYLYTERVEWVEWAEWNGGMERVEWNGRNGMGGMERVEWNGRNGMGGMERVAVWLQHPVARVADSYRIIVLSYGFINGSVVV